jgi:hypothetical protein
MVGHGIALPGGRGCSPSIYSIAALPKEPQGTTVVTVCPQDPDGVRKTWMRSPVPRESFSAYTGFRLIYLHQGLPRGRATRSGMTYLREVGQGNWLRLIKSPLSRTFLGR